MFALKYTATLATCFWRVTQCRLSSQSFELRDSNIRSINYNESSLQVDLGYAVYEGVANSTTGLNTFKGIRFAAPPTGPLRWQAPQPPSTNRSSTLSASEYGPICPQSFNAVPGNAYQEGDEDCLFLNIYAPPNAVGLPVLVWIHGGGYGFYNGQQDMSEMINTNNNTFIGVSIQYRLGAFGFLSSDEVHRFGIVNAGLLDQKFAFEWIQYHIDAFGGDPDRVTISGLSAGAGSVMLHDIAYGGTLGTSLFRQSITASPYLPTQYRYNDFLPTQAYYAFATAAGCPPTYAYGNSSQTIFACLQSKETGLLQRASNDISTSGTFGSWAFLPVTDNLLLQETPSQALLKRKINGERHLTANTAEEGPAYTPQTITTENDLVAWIQHTFPLLTPQDVQKILFYYPIDTLSNLTTLPTFPTAGDKGPSAVTTSQVASGHQQRANAILGETTFICPSYWLATAYNSPSTGHHSWKYQYSVPTALHGYDLEAYFGPARRKQGPELTRALQTVWGNFVRFGKPSTTAYDDGSNQTSLDIWPEFDVKDPKMANLNQSSGTPYQFTVVQSRNDGPLTVIGEDRNVTLYGEPGLKNEIRIVDAFSWEGGRGYRCDFWRSIGGIVPE
ncbi:alpha/beta-hydrolase [Aaosphaeria arxii CBS 175.79]|uniref:Carboxylic ester hydrolase n=1 Tax=Aaosphaeria arxii CBS 175.79 TaxID=1450172 RepID=A0A6A5XG79_9PLEO|nr:alpha/beta-hydrolase [Aaosphaeria arxii CBS 175.79]KAF2011837.1 alpha/beta-hydrolase [Aaosphaeria arxii CBS 175.79]